MASWRCVRSASCRWWMRARTTKPICVHVEDSTIRGFTNVGQFPDTSEGDPQFFMEYQNMENKEGGGRHQSPTAKSSPAFYRAVQKAVLLGGERFRPESKTCVPCRGGTRR